MTARQDQTTDPELLEALLQARRGTAFFARKLNELSDEDLDGPSLLPGWNRRHVTAHIGYNARAIARLIEWAATGTETPMYASPEARDHEISFGATLPPIALRYLFDHSAVHLNVEWRDLPAQAWHHQVKTAQGRVVPATETVWMRTREVWTHAIDLDNGAAFSDIPAPVLERLLTDITTAWHTRGTDTGLLINVTGPDLTFGDTTAQNPTLITGTLPGITQWATGRGTRGVTATHNGTPLDETPAAPKWI
ncbi:maleylpyruvate isomerase family mycothiol-dependent enzyme [Pseudarthrobacter raffinosi]|uniref:maleylpyruvate isomerase family mycothiol-dependent enzyme n=1 Tax=Pseudarthrobacter raffinosi TaxID=2953651 RepID=UPI00208ED298|nr:MULTISPECIES: maleylpyruvate isomerase family mycothiol-dependent enzyme [unclassified Pseudarthrobacter]MCO4236444.1 maleylpyruvate isomerase family mycothiol-dependent enzyme [Pseudarthrobacter sp. MDT3-28]MCO4249912.1 maleylpyruvate isomerase family mycothiol-dependent enzyme [Pseudarthrobacter sp. MDT3-9]MCO4262367.1 maleylpyruvate isomerase family mycothiol-dependent enzyme [Pseudarthrobacter sp. MDT3-26]